MDKLKDIIWNTGIVMTFGAYHFYLMDEQWKLQQEIYRLQDAKSKEMLEEMKKTF